MIGTLEPMEVFMGSLIVMGEVGPFFQVIHIMTLRIKEYLI